MNPLPYSTSERRAGLATGPQLRFLSDGDLLPMRISDGATLLPALPETLPALPETLPTFELRTPNRTPNREADLIVPAGQAAALALAVLIGGGAVALALGLSGRLVLLAFGVALIGGWFWRQRVSDGLLWAVETATGLDLDRNGAIGKPQHTYTVLQPAAARETVARETRETAQSAEHAALLAFVDRCYMRGTSEGSHGIKATGPDRAEYVRRRDVLLALGVAQWRNPARPRAGWQMVVSPHTARQIVEKHVLKST